MELANETREHFLYRLFYPKEYFFNTCVTSQRKVHRIHFQNIHTFTYQKTFLHAHLCLFLKSLKTFSVSLIKSNKFTTLLKKRLWHWCFPVSFAKFLKRSFFQNIYGRLLRKKSMEESGVIFS